MRLTLVHNPEAGDDAGSADELRSMLSDARYQVRVVSTAETWPEALHDPGDLVVAAGGDGTARQVALALAGTDTPFAVLPFGTANNLGKTLGMVGDARSIIESWRDAKPVPLDLGEATFDGGTRRFVESAGGGIFADLIAEADAAIGSALFVGRETDRALHLLRTLADSLAPVWWEVEADGRDVSGMYVGVEVFNARFAGPNVPIALRADPGDGRFDLVRIDDAIRRRILEYADQRLATASAEFEAVRVDRVKAVTINAPDGTRFHIDDSVVPDDSNDPAVGDRALQVKILPGACRVIGEP
jgi:diacylglycerol kinase family enzyme